MAKHRKDMNPDRATKENRTDRDEGGRFKARSDKPGSPKPGVVDNDIDMEPESDDYDRSPSGQSGTKRNY